MNPQLKQALAYISNTGGSPTIEQFDDDHDPVGPMLRKELKAAWMVYECDGKIHLDSEYGEGTRGRVSVG